MELKNSTVLITGGSNGIGLEFAKQLLQQGATVIITGRSLAKLEHAKTQFPEINIIQSDVNDPDNIKALYKKVTVQFPGLNIIINNAGVMVSADLLDEKTNLENITAEIDTNFSGVIRMNHHFLPYLITKKSAAIINITSGLAFIPFTISPIYCGTKAGIHIYSQGLRLQLKNTKVKVFEVAPPKTDKPLQTAIPKDSSDAKVMKVDKMVSVAIKGILNDKYEIRPGLANVMKWMSRIAPDFFARLIDKNVEKAKVKARKKST